MTQAGATTSANATDLSFEQLTSIEVSGVSKSVERVLDAPAAVTVITSDQIRSYGFRTMAEVLNTVPGFFTYSDGAYAYVGVRGFAPIESYNSRVLLLIDGFPANDNFFQQALIGNEGVVDLALIDRIEVIRGPGSSVYGNNALLGVINVILKNPSQMDSGAQAWLGAGGERGASGTLGTGAGEDLRYLLRVSESGSRGLDVTYGPQPGLPFGARVSGMDGTDVTRAFAKILDGNLRINLGFSERRQRTGYGLYGDVIGDPRSFVRDGETFADVHYEGSLGAATDYVLRASAAEYRYDSEEVDPTTAAALPYFLPALGDWIDTEATATHHFSSQNRLVLGLQARRDMRENMTERDPVDGTFLQIKNGETRFGLYGQSDVEWSEHWSTSVGLRDDLDDNKNRVNPRLALLWKPDAQQVLKLLYGSSYREANAFEKFFAQPPSVLASPTLSPERMHTIDAVYEVQFSETSHLSLTAFSYRASDLITQVVVDPATDATQYQNAQAERARGIDISFEQRLLPALIARWNASYTSASEADGSREQNAPHWSGRLGLEQRLPADWRVAAEALYAGQRLAIDDAPVPGFLVANCTLTSAPHPDRPDLSLSVFNLFDHSYAMPVAGWLGDRVNQPGRTWRVTAGYSF